MGGSRPGFKVKWKNVPKARLWVTEEDLFTSVLHFLTFQKICLLTLCGDKVLIGTSSNFYMRYKHEMELEKL